MIDNTQRFNKKVTNYIKYRPNYSPEMITTLINQIGLNSKSVVADIGAGTGIFTRQLADYVGSVYAVEPNIPMFEALEVLSKSNLNIVFINAPAESTTLPDNSVDCICVAQAFHWFDKDKTKREFKRILRKSGKVILIWNWPVINNIVIEYDKLLTKYCPEFKGYNDDSKSFDKDYSGFFSNGYSHYEFENYQKLVKESFIGECLSSSYAPNSKDKYYHQLITDLNTFFEKYSKNEELLFPLKSHCFIGSVD